MKPSTAEWVGKVEGDWEMALKAYRARKAPVYDAAGYHSQQCAEKYLKASLVEAGLAVARTHLYNCPPRFQEIALPERLD
jgi:HEPN domain-containing protein